MPAQLVARDLAHAESIDSLGISVKRGINYASAKPSLP
jgi:hypothetical protein